MTKAYTGMDRSSIGVILPPGVLPIKAKSITLSSSRAAGELLSVMEFSLKQVADRLDR